VNYRYPGLVAGTTIARRLELNSNKTFNQVSIKFCPYFGKISAGQTRVEQKQFFGHEPDMVEHDIVLRSEDP
jgi:hypothetical protein